MTKTSQNNNCRRPRGGGGGGATSSGRGGGAGIDKRTSSGPHKGKKTSCKRKPNFNRNCRGNNNYGAKTEKENGASAYKAGYRRGSGGRPAVPSTANPFMLDGEVVPKLDQSDPVQARRIQQRRRMVMFGKNTAGYDEYCKQVPREKRRLRCLEQPQTPPHTLDIPNRRWQGMVKAWRRALHKFDPPDLKDADVHKPQDPLVAAMASTFAATAVVAGQKEEAADRPASTDGGVQAKQIADAASSGMLVDFGTRGGQMHEEEEAKYQEMIQQAEEENTDDLVANIAFGGGKSTGDDLGQDDDSDDDLL